jgi:Zn-dependent protease
MILALPPSTPYDLNFRVAGFPVRIHPGFWIAGLVFGFNEDFKLTLIWVTVLFLSILVHELGHAVAGRLFGGRPYIVLYWMGGLCASNGEQNRAQRAIVLAAGPGAGLVLAGLTVLGAMGYYKIGWAAALALATGDGWGNGIYDTYVVRSLFFVNFYWSLVNLLPVWSLDGGQLLETFLNGRRHPDRMRTVHIVSVITAGLVAYAMYQRGLTFAAILFVMLALENVAGVSRTSGPGSGYQSYDDDSSGRWGR